MTETAYRRKLVKKIETEILPGCFIIKPDPREHQGIPDILILFGNRWAMLEFKRHSKASIRPNQKHFVERFGEMAFASFIYPENEEQVLDDLQSALWVSR